MPTFNTYNTANYSAQTPTRLNPSRLQLPNVASGSVQFATILHTLVGSESSANGGDVINLAILPAGVIPLPQLSSVSCEVPGTSSPSLAVDVGTASDAAGWGHATLTAGGLVPMMGAGTPPSFFNPTPLAEDAATKGNVTVFAKVTAAANLTAGRKVVFTLAYKIGS